MVKHAINVLSNKIKKLIALAIKGAWTESPVYEKITFTQYILLNHQLLGQGGACIKEY